MSEGDPSPVPSPTVRLHGCHLHLIVTDPTNGNEAEAALHLQHTGKIGISKPYWAHSMDIAQKAMPILAQVLEVLTSVANDPLRWPTPEAEAQGALPDTDQ